jgi:hypothetical protein
MTGGFYETVFANISYKIYFITIFSQTLVPGRALLLLTSFQAYEHCESYHHFCFLLCLGHQEH